jgi:hypothetical protein
MIFSDLAARFGIDLRSRKLVPYRVPHNYLNSRFEIQPLKAFEKFTYL